MLMEDMEFGTGPDVEVTMAGEALGAQRALHGLVNTNADAALQRLMLTVDVERLYR